MARPWRKHAVDFWCNPKIVRACAAAGGPRPAILASILLDLNDRMGRGGQLRDSDVDPIVLQGHLRFVDAAATSEDVERALQALVDVGFLERVQGGARAARALRIVGYTSEWMPQCTRCGSAHSSATHTRCEACRSEDIARRKSRRDKGKQPPRESARGTRAERTRSARGARAEKEKEKSTTTLTHELGTGTAGAAAPGRQGSCVSAGSLLQKLTWAPSAPRASRPKPRARPPCGERQVRAAVEAERRRRTLSVKGLREAAEAAERLEDKLGWLLGLGGVA